MNGELDYPTKLELLAAHYQRRTLQYIKTKFPCFKSNHAYWLKDWLFLLDTRCDDATRKLRQEIMTLWHSRPWLVNPANCLDLLYNKAVIASEEGVPIPVDNDLRQRHIHALLNWRGKKAVERSQALRGLKRLHDDPQKMTFDENVLGPRGERGRSGQNKKLQLREQYVNLLAKYKKRKAQVKQLREENKQLKLTIICE